MKENVLLQTDKNPQDYNPPLKGAEERGEDERGTQSIVLWPLYAKRAQKPDEANPMSSAEGKH
jgi:hypothetical protein